jgi:hypothetical protein
MQLGAQPPVEPDRRPVPVEDGPLHPPTASLHRNARDGPQQGAAHALAPLLGKHEEVFQVERGAGEKRRVGEEVEGEAHGPAIAPSDERLEVGPLAEAVAPQAASGRLDLMAEPLVLRQATDQSQDRRCVA